MKKETLNEFERLSNDVKGILIKLMEQIKKGSQPSENCITNNTLK